MRRVQYSLLLVLVFAAVQSGSATSTTRSIEVAVLGGGAAGVGAAIAAARQGVRVLLIEETDRLGGMMSNGVCRTDIGRPPSSNGLFEEFRTRIADYYDRQGQLAASNKGFIYEPDVADFHLKQMVEETTGIETLWGYYLAEKGGVEKEGHRLQKILLENESGEKLTVSAQVFIDATDTGDILGQAGVAEVDWTYGRENMSDYNERHNGHIYVDPVTQQRSGGTGKGDKLIQAYNYRVTYQVNGFTGYPVPANYEANLPLFRMAPPGGGSCIINGKEYRDMWIQAIVPNNKLDINLDRVGINHRYPLGSRAERKKIAQAHKDFALGYLHYLRTERGMPEMGLSSDDYEEHGHFPPLMYVREARRMLGEFVFTENDALPAEGRPRAPRKRDSVAIGTYGMDSHCVSDAEVTTRSCEGGFWIGVAPYQIPYGVMVPRRIEGLLVPHAASGTHVGFSTMRMEPVRMNLGQAAGTAAAIAIRDNLLLRKVPIGKLQHSLADQQQMLIYFADVSPRQPGFAAIQRLGVRGAVFGRGDFTFGSGDFIRRWILAKWIVLAMQFPIEKGGPPAFPDVPENHPGYSYVQTLYKRGVLRGHYDGYFRPDADATRGNVVAAVLMSAGAEYTGETVASFDDVPVSDARHGFVATLLERIPIEARADGTFGMEDSATREFAAIVLDAFAPLKP